MIETLIFLASLTSFQFDTKWCEGSKNHLWHYTRIHTDNTDYIGLCISNMKRMWVYNSNVLLYTISHELWHLYWHKFMTEEQQLDWYDLSLASTKDNDYYRTWRNNSIPEEDFAEIFASLYVPFYNDVLRIRTPHFREKQDFIKYILY